MNTLSPQLYLENLLTVDAHPDDREMKYADLIAKSRHAFSYTATRGEASPVNLARGSLCRSGEDATRGSSSSC